MKKLTLIFCLILSCLTFSAKALSISDLDGMIVGQMFHGHFGQKEMGTKQATGRFVVEGSQLYIENFLGTYKLPVTLSNNKITIGYATNANGTDGTTLLLGSMVCSLSADNAFYYPDAKSAGASSNYNHTGYGYNYAGVDLTSNTVVESSGIYTFTFPGTEYAFACVRSNNSNYVDIYHKVVLECYKPNATVKAYSGSSVGLQYGARVIFNDNNTFDLYNYKVLGKNFRNNSSSKTTTPVVIQGSYTSGNSVSIPKTEIGGTVNNFAEYPGFRYANWKNTYNNFLIQTYDEGYNYRAYWIIDLNVPKFKKAYLTNSSGGAVTGSLEWVNVRHEGLSDGWVLPGTTLTTIADAEITLGASKVYQDFNGSVTQLSAATSEEIYVNDAKIMTHSVEPEVTSCGADPSKYGLFIRGSIKPQKNNDFVKGYKIYAVPGKYTSYAQIKGILDAETGIKGAVDITSSVYDTGFNASRSTSTENIYDATHGELIPSLSEPVSFGKQILPSDLPADFALKNGGNYTVFIKTVYNNGLPATYHGLASYSATTGIEDILGENSGNDISISVSGSAVVISGNDGSVEIFDSLGRLVYKGSESRITLPSGVYVVSASGKSAKVMVK